MGLFKAATVWSMKFYVINLDGSFYKHDPELNVLCSWVASACDATRFKFKKDAKQHIARIVAWNDARGPCRTGSPMLQRYELYELVGPI